MFFFTTSSNILCSSSRTPVCQFQTINEICYGLQLLSYLILPTWLLKRSSMISSALPPALLCVFSSMLSSQNQTLSLLLPLFSFLSFLLILFHHTPHLILHSTRSNPLHLPLFHTLYGTLNLSPSFSLLPVTSSICLFPSLDKTSHLDRKLFYQAAASKPERDYLRG